MPLIKKRTWNLRTKKSFGQTFSIHILRFVEKLEVKEARRKGKRRKKKINTSGLVRLEWNELWNLIKQVKKATALCVCRVWEFRVSPEYHWMHREKPKERHAKLPTYFLSKLFFFGSLMNERRLTKAKKIHGFGYSSYFLPLKG